MNATLPSHRFVVSPDWIDHNGHMNVAYYVLAFDLATDAVYDAWGLGLDYPARSGCSVFTLGMNVDYRSELFEGDAFVVTTQLVDCDEKRIHYFHRMVREQSGRLAATNECLCMNVHVDSRRGHAFDPSVLDRLSAVLESHRAYGSPDGFGRTLGIRRKT